VYAHLITVGSFVSPKFKSHWTHLVASQDGVIAVPVTPILHTGVTSTMALTCCLEEKDRMPVILVSQAYQALVLQHLKVKGHLPIVDTVN
jgi:hypothetical protein